MIDIREHRTEHFNRQRLLLEARRGARPLVMVLLGLAAAAAVFGYIFSNVSRTLFKGTETLKFRISDATAVVPGVDDVRFKGIPAGTITTVSTGDGSPVVTIQLQSKYGAIYRDAHAVLRPNTPLMDMYLDITDPGHPAAGKATASTPLPAAQTQTSVNIDDVLNTFSADSRSRLRSLLANMGNGLADRGAALREAFAELSPFLVNAGRITTQLGDRNSMTRQLVHNASVLTGVLGQRQTELRRLEVYLGSTVKNLQAGSTNLDATLHALPPTLSALRNSFTTVSSVLGDVNNAVTSLDPVADQLPTSLSAIKALSASADPAVKALQQPVSKLVPFTQALRPISASLETTVKALTPQVPAFDKTTTDLANCKKGVQGFFQWDASISKLGDAAGPVPRGNLVIGAGTSAITPGPFAGFVPECTSGTPVGGRAVTTADLR